MGIVFLIAVFWIQLWLGVLAACFALALIGVAWLNARRTAQALSEAGDAARLAQSYATQSLQNAPVVAAMGMQAGLRQHWLARQTRMLTAQAQASDLAGVHSALTRFLQLGAGSFLLGAGCWLIIDGTFADTGGLLIIASILGGKLLTPLAQAIGGWRQFVSAREAFTRLDQLLAEIPEPPPSMPLPPPKGVLTVENVSAAPPGETVPVLRQLRFHAQPGQVLAIVGPSASGKSTLAQLLVGVWPAQSGQVRLDGVDLFGWNKTELGPQLGYLPQQVELFEGTIEENIRRFGPPDAAQLRKAAEDAGLLDAVAALPGGFATPIDAEGRSLCGGLRQKIGLARAFYGNPRLIVLDEPNANLDQAGEAALSLALEKRKAQGATLIVITHRPQVLAVADNMLVLKDGKAALFGKRAEVLAALQRPRPNA
jgi:ATP-binding cassette subfamily C exporter for protease/lipase